MRLQIPRAMAALLVAGPVAAQNGSISGVVTDRTTRTPIEGVSITIAGTNTGVVTRQNGSYVILNVPPGLHTMVARRIGYESVEIANVAINPNVERRQDFQLSARQTIAPVTEPGVVRPGTVRPDPSGPLIEWGVFGARPGPPGGARTIEQGSVFSFEHLLFPPELVMQHQRALELTADQRRTITEAVKALQNQTVDLQWNLQAEQQALLGLLEKRPINEAAAVQQMAKLVELEDAVKRTHLATLIKIKNALTEKQVTYLNSVRSR